MNIPKKFNGFIWKNTERSLCFWVVSILISFGLNYRVEGDFVGFILFRESDVFSGP